jgi:hypothetical protein
LGATALRLIDEGTSMKRSSMQREQRLRRVLICSCAIIRNVAYYKGGWRDGRPVFTSNIERTINGNFMDMAVLEWCKLFGEPRHEPQHWQHVLTNVEQRREFKHGLLEALSQKPTEWKAHVQRCIRYRSDFIAHLGSESVMQTPHLDPVWKSAAFYYEFLRSREMPDADPVDVFGFYETCASAAREHYKSRI